MSTIFHSTAAVTASSAAAPCKPARGVVRPAELKCSNYSISPYADFEFFVPYLVSKCAMCIACYGFDYVTLFNFTDHLLTFLLFFIQNFRIQFRLRNRQSGRLSCCDLLRHAGVG